jgi:hypothetical protein
MKNTSINPHKQFTSKNRYDLLSHKDLKENMETHTDTDIIDKKPPPIFVKSIIQNYFDFCENIKKAIEPNSNFFDKSTTGASKINLSTTKSIRAIIKFLIKILK